MIELNNSVRAFYLQFSFSNKNAVPAWLPWKEDETLAEAKARKERSTRGASVNAYAIEPTEGCSLETLPGEIAAAGFTLVDAYAQRRIDPNNPKKEWYMARYIFIPTGDVTRDELGEYRKEIEIGLADLCLLALWRVRAWKNPYFKDDEPIDGLFAASVNLEARKPLYQPNGKPVAVWQKDSAGNRVGTAPQPLAPAHILAIHSNTLQLIPF